MEHEQATTLVLLGLLLSGSVLAGRAAARFRLPAMTGQLVVGFAIGEACSSWLVTAAGSLFLMRQGLGAVLLFWIGSQLKWERLRLHRRTVVSLGAAVLVNAVVCASVIALPITQTFDTSPLGPITRTDILVGALVLSATSPTVIAVVSQEQRAMEPFARASLEAAVLANSGLLVLIVFALGMSSGTAPGGAIGSVGLARDVFAGLAVGGTLGALVAFGGRRLIPGSLQVALAGVAVVLLEQELVHSDAAIMAGSFFAGVVVAHSERERAVAKVLSKTVAGVSAGLFVTAGALIELDLVLAMAAPALALSLVRAGSSWVGARIAGGMTGDPIVRRFGFAPLLPQAGFSLAVLGALGGPHGLSAALASLIVAVVVINETAMPPIFRFALNAVGRSHAAGRSRTAGDAPSAV
jgi:Kef-type K+ transport system membrane component KefB